jgi:predicted ribosome-associated RNA-binding protein Tma20
MPTQRRYSLKAKEAKQIIDQTNQTLKLNLEKDIGIEVVETEKGEIYLFAGKPLLFNRKTAFYPRCYLASHAKPK